MAFKEIVTKAIVGKGKKYFKNSYDLEANDAPSTILGCWVINHKFKGYKTGEKVGVSGSYDVNIWYSHDNDTKTEVLKETNTYREVINMRDREDVSGEEIIVRSLKQPNCVNVNIDGNNINYTIEKELGIELVGDIKVKIETNEEEDPWDEIVEEEDEKEAVEPSYDPALESIDSVNEKFIEDAI